MSVPITTIQGSDNVGLSRLTINTNFAALKAASDAVTALLDPTTLSLAGIKSITIDDASSPLSSSILSVSKGASILGRVVMGTVGASTSVLINGNGGVTLSEANLNISLGNLLLSSSSSLLTAGGHFSLAGENRMPGIATAYVDTIGLTATTTYPIAVASKKYVVITNGATNSAAPFGLTASLQAGTSGQIIELYHVKGPSGPVLVDTSNFYGLTGSVTMTETGDLIKCHYEGSSWYLWDFTPATASSITINRL